MSMPTARDIHIAALEAKVLKLTARVGELEAHIARGVIVPTPGRLTAEQIQAAALRCPGRP